MMALLYSDRELEEVREIGGPRYDYVSVGHRTLITSNWFYDVDSSTTHLEQLTHLLGEGMAVQVVNKANLKPYGISRHGQFFIAHKKGHDHYVFELSNENHPFTIDWHTDESGMILFKQLYVNKLVLVGEGNALRKVRRWVKRQLTDGRKSFKKADLAIIKARAQAYGFDVVLVTDNGFIMDLQSNKLVASASIPNSKEQIAVQGWTQTIIRSGCKVVPNRDPSEVMLNQALMLSNR